MVIYRVKWATVYSLKVPQSANYYIPPSFKGGRHLVAEFETS